MEYLIAIGIILLVFAMIISLFMMYVSCRVRRMKKKDLGSDIKVERYNPTQAMFDEKWNSNYYHESGK